MAKQSLNTLKNWFKRGLKPLENQFADWLDSFWHKDDTTIPIGNIQDLQNTLNGLASNAAVTALDAAKEDKNKKGVANGYASLDGTGKVPSGQLPSFVDDVLEFANVAGFPGAGESGKIYIAIDTNLSYRWSGSAYVQVTSIPSDASETVKGIAEISNQAEAEDAATNPTIGNVDHSRTFSGRSSRWFWEKTKEAKAASNITANIAGGAVVIAANSKRETEVYLKTDANLNISWTNLNEGGIIYLRIERSTSGQISVNFNGSTNTDCFMDGSSQQLGAASPLLLPGHNGAVGINRRHYRLSIESVKEITANKIIYMIRESSTGSIQVS